MHSHCIDLLRGGEGSSLSLPSWPGLIEPARSLVERRDEALRDVA